MNSLATLALLLPTTAVEPTVPAPVHERPSFIIVVFDDMGKYDLEVDATIATPRIDAFRAASRVFERAYTQSSMCSPSRVALTGDLGRRHGIGRRIGKIELNDLAPTPTLASRLKSAGWSTCIAGKWHLSSGQNYDLATAPAMFGFDAARGVAAFNPQATKPGGSYFDWLRLDDGTFADSTEYMTAAQPAAAAEWWNETEGPKFLWLGFSAAHDPFHEAPAPYYTGPPTTTTREQFESMVEAADDRFGAFLDSIALEHTYVFVWSDNGTPDKASEPPQVPGKLKRSMYEGGIGTPFYVQGPTVESGTTRRLVSMVDLYATIVDLANVRGGTPDSYSFADELGGVSTTFGERDWVFAERFSPNGFPAVYASRERALVRRDGWKLILEEVNGVEKSRELFHLPTDPLENTPLTNPSIESQLDAILSTAFP